MSSEQETPQVEQRSRFKVVLNAKHEVQWEVSIVAGSTREELDELRQIAVEQHNALVAELLGGRAVA